MKHPRDPGRHPYASIWDFQDMHDLEAAFPHRRIELDQCRCGARSKKPTEIGVFGPGADVFEVTHHIDLQCNHSEHDTILRGLDATAAMFKTSAAQVYSSEMCQLLAKSMLAILAIMSTSPSGPDPMGLCLSLDPILTFTPSPSGRDRPDASGATKYGSSRWALIGQSFLVGDWHTREDGQQSNTPTFRKHDVQWAFFDIWHDLGRLPISGCFYSSTAW